MTDENLPELATYKQLDTAMLDLMKKKMAAGDPTSAANVAAMGMQFANNMNSGDSGKFLINSLVARGTENTFVSQLDPNTAYDFLNGQTPVQVQQQLKDAKADFKQLQSQFQPVETSMYQEPSAMDAYFQRMLIYGEPAAMKWAIQQYSPPSSTSPGQQ